MSNSWIADRTRLFDSSGIRKVFDLASKMESPIDLSIGQPDYDVPEPVRAACIQAIESGKNNYALTQGMPVLREKLQARIDRQYGHDDRRVFVSSGTSGGIVLTLLSMVNPGDEVIIFDPYFVMYEALTRLVGGTPVLIPTYPDFCIPLDRVADAITDKTKMILLNSPANPTGAVATVEAIRGLAQLAQQHEIALVSDEIYSEFCYDAPFVSPAQFNERTIVIDGFSKNYAMTGWRLGFVHGPAEVIETMVKVQQYTFVCAAAGPVGRGRGHGRGRQSVHRGLPSEARLDRRRPVRPVRDRQSAGRFLRLPQDALGYGHRVRQPGDRKPPAGDSGQGVQPAGHAFPHFLRRVERRDPARHRRAAKAGAAVSASAHLPARHSWHLLHPECSWRPNPGINWAV